MSCRTWLAGSALTAAVLATGVAGALASTHTGKKTSVSCNITAATAVPKGDTAVTPPVDQGRNYGQAKCGKPLGSGLLASSFKRQDSGDLKGQFREYFPNGTVQGVYVLTPGEGQPSAPSSFSAESYAGTVTVQGGTGAYKGVKGKGAMKCSSPDGVHIRCSQKVTLPRL